ncbi:hypothetical protein D915_010214 [Fasciola hepatica]|uniref:Uncharacterized protein n=1 Tax=Fasciola hepatica TaxID=6192 RepID=A0A4E0QUJ0_FASHE|nr:hypothetical protein D915_010214 [Fasciola hepatica]
METKSDLVQKSTASSTTVFWILAIPVLSTESSLCYSSFSNTEATRIKFVSLKPLQYLAVLPYFSGSNSV